MNALTSLQVGSPISYLIALIIPALDAIFPVLPSETAIIALGVATAGSTDPRIALLVTCAAVGAFLGDNLCYLLGRRFGSRVERRFFTSGKGARRREWAEHSLQRFGTRIIVVCRFIPCGRTAVTLSCGLIGYPRRRFVIATAVAAIIWALYAFFIGRLGGKAFEEKPWAGLLIAFAATLAVSGLIEAVQRIRGRRRGTADRAAPRHRFFTRSPRTATRLHGRDQGLNQLPLGLGEVCGISAPASHGGHPVPKPPPPCALPRQGLSRHPLVPSFTCSAGAEDKDSGPIASAVRSGPIASVLRSVRSGRSGLTASEVPV